MKLIATFVAISLSLAAFCQDTFDIHYDISNNDAYGLYMRQTAEGSFLCLAQSRNTTPTPDVYAVRAFMVDSLGVLQWDSIVWMANDSTHVNRIADAPDGGFLVWSDDNLLRHVGPNGTLLATTDVSGTLQSNAEVFDNARGTGYWTGGSFFGFSPNADVQIVRLDDNLNISASAILGGNGHDELVAIAPANDDGALIMTVVRESATDTDHKTVIYRISSSGQLVWTDTIPYYDTFWPTVAAHHPSGVWAVTGYLTTQSGEALMFWYITDAGVRTSNTAFFSHQRAGFAFCPDSSSLVLAGAKSNTLDRGIWLFRRRNTAEEDWSKRYETSTQFEQFGHGIVTNNGGYGLIGSSAQAGLKKPVLLITDAEGELVSVAPGPTGLQNTLPLAGQLSVFPNPVAQGSAATIATTAPAHIAVYDVTGKLVAAYHSTTHPFRLATETMQPGIYLLAGTQNGLRNTQRLIVR